MKNNIFIIILSLLAISYFIAYMIWSELKIQESGKLGIKGFYYVDRVEYGALNRACVVIFYPCDLIRVAVFNGTAVGADPLVHLGDRQ